MSDDTTPKPASLTEQWFQEQQAWAKTMRDYSDTMAKDDEFLTHLGNAMRGSLLAGVPYPTPAADMPKDPVIDRLEQLLFAVKRVAGRLADVEDAVRALEERSKPSAAALTSSAGPSAAATATPPAAGSATPSADRPSTTPADGSSVTRSTAPKRPRRATADVNGDAPADPE